METIKKILIADDHTIVSKGLTYLFDLNFTDCNITEVSTMQESLKQLCDLSYTHLILDLNLKDGNSLDYIPKIIETNPHLHILVYSMASEDVFGKKLLEMDTSGFLSKASSEIEVLNALRIFLEGGVYKSRHLRNVLNHSDIKLGENIFLKLSASEHRVLDLILRGKRTKEISIELNVADQTIATFKSRIFKKLSTDNIFEIKKLAELNGINFSVGC